MSRLPFLDRFPFHPPQDFTPRRWQVECKDDFRKACHEKKEGQLTFFVHAATGAGKLKLAAMLAAEALNSGLVRRVLYVCPNRVIRAQAIRTFRTFGIYLVEWLNAKHASEGEPCGTQGGALTYQTLARAPAAQARLACALPTLVIFDEIHHLGDSREWEQAARAAFEGTAVAVVGLSGTPYRADNREIPFVHMLPPEGEVRRYKADYPYPFGRAIVDGYCRRPEFIWLNGEVELTVNGNTRTASFADDLSEEMANLRLSGAVRPGSGARTDALRLAVDECRRLGRKLIIFLGGDSNADTLATDDAKEHLPAELIALGVPPEQILTVTSASDRAVEKLQSFGASPATILITVNMVSEGVDIPEVSAVLFLTSVTAKATTVQRIGRGVRGNDPATVLVFMFRDRRYVAFAEEIERERCEWEIRLRRPRPEGEPEGNGDGRRRQADATGIRAWEDGLTVNGRTYSQFQVHQARARLRSRNRPDTAAYLEATLDLLFPEAAAR
jgi:superfamily II DNA or RNA helicase